MLSFIWDGIEQTTFQSKAPQYLKSGQALAPKLSYAHQQFNVEQLQIYVNTIDPSAMAAAYHYVHLKCDKPFNRFELIKLGKVDWAYEYRFYVNGNKLVMHNDHNNQTHAEFSLKDLSCR
ncbi:hypothetical protein [Paraferrimonas sp. SM1919]|uniref:hypothetical protein n=1 Tax=Paraferrimonas sp. SM1919 TaxID=2662263 RepID=UPI0013D87418|nr:hypothetical protein [Paraferrimonas sp. SM1919]